MSAFPNIARLRRRPVTLLIVCLAVLIRLLAATDKLSAASNYKPILGAQPFRSESDGAPPFIFRPPRSTGFNAQNRDNNEPTLWRRRTPADDFGYRPFPEGARDSFGVTAPQERDFVPRLRFRDGNHSFPQDSVPYLGAEQDQQPTSPLRRSHIPPSRPTDERSQSRVDESPDPQELITRRYEDPAVLRFIASLSAERAIAMYSETLQLIESRHLAPPAPQVLVQRGISNLLESLQNPTFQRVNGMGSMTRETQEFQRSLAGLLRAMPVATTSDAVSALQTVMETVGRQLRMSPVLAAIEFEYGALESLDRFSAFVPSEAARLTNQQLGEAVVGVGVQIEAADEGLRILKVLPEGPAAEAGLQKGDLIVAVDSQPLAGRDLSSASSLITGREGSTVELSIVRPGGAFPREVALPRQSIAVHSVTDVQMIDSAAGVGYLKLETFAANSAEELEQALWTLQRQGMRSLILDLRGDPGGLLTTAIAIADLFLPDGTIVSTRGRTSSDNMTERASQPQTWKVPLVLLVDENSASASEILAAAIQENGRGTVVGRHTYGKGTVQTLFPLQSVSAGLRLTTARFYSPSGREMAGAGVEPDVPVPATPASAQGELRTDRDLQTALSLAERGSRPDDHFSVRGRMPPAAGGQWRQTIGH